MMLKTKADQIMGTNVAPKTKPDEIIGTRLEPLSVDIATACSITGLGRFKLYELLGANEIRSIKCGKRRLISVAALRERLAKFEASVQQTV